MQRMPATYAANRRVFAEIRARYPSFQPRRMLDFGAGPGTSVWAAHDTWGQEAVREATLVEPSLAMLHLGRLIQEERADSTGEQVRGAQEGKRSWGAAVWGLSCGHSPACMCMCVCASHNC